MVGWASSKVGEKKLKSNILRLEIIDTRFGNITTAQNYTQPLG